MIVYASRKFARRLKCDVSEPNERPGQETSLDSWSADVLKLPRVGEFAVVINNASLSTFIFPLKGVSKFETFLVPFLRKAAALFARHGKHFDTGNQNILVLGRSDRSLIGTMNEAKFFIQIGVAEDLENGIPIDWECIEADLNETIYSRIGYDCLNERLAKLLS